MKPSKKQDEAKAILPPGRYFSFKKLDGIESELTSILVKEDGTSEVLSSKVDLPRILIAKLLEEISQGYNN